jgi:ligand-binding sensor domain-containing protein
MSKIAFVFLGLMLHTFFCCAQSGWIHFDTENSPLLDNRVSSIAIDHDNNLWGAYSGAGGFGNGIVKFDGNSWTHYNTTNSGLPNDDIRDIAVDLQGNVWFACYNAGIVKFNGTTWTRYYSSNSNIAGNDVVDMEFDSNGNLWVGCYFSGVSKFDGTTWTTYTKDNAPFPDSNCISDLTIDNSNNVWVGMYCGGGMAKFSSSSGTWTGYTTSNSSIPDHTVTSLLADASGVIWASHINVNVSSFNGSIWTAYDVPDAIDKFGLDMQGNLWGCGYGLFKFENEGWTETTIPEAADTTYALGLAVGTAGNFWLSTYAGLWLNQSIVITDLQHRAEVEVKFFPNPASTTLTCTAGSLLVSSGIVIITDLMGREVRRGGVTADNPTLDVSDLPSGVYLVKLVQDHSFSKLHKVVKAR